MVHALGASVHVTPSGRRVLEMALFFERLDAAGADVCGTYIGSHWWRLQCSVGGKTVPASVLSGLAWVQPTKSNLVACALPPHGGYPLSVLVDRLAEDGAFSQPMRLELCALAGLAPSGAAVCTEPLHSLRGGRLLPDLVEHHLQLGFRVDLYDSDGSAGPAFERFRRLGPVAHFPRFVARHFGERLGSEEAAGIHEPAAGCSAGMQEIHCLFRHRGRSRWVAPRLDPDEYFHMPSSGRLNRSVIEVLASLEGARHVFVPSLEFGGRPAAAEGQHVAERFPLTSGILNPQWIVLSDPANAMSSHMHAVRPRPGTHDDLLRHANGSLLRVNHYLEMFGPRFVPFIHASRQQYRSRDRSLLSWLRRREAWAERGGRVLRGRG